MTSRLVHGTLARPLAAFAVGRLAVGRGSFGTVRRRELDGETLRVAGDELRRQTLGTG